MRIGHGFDIHRLVPQRPLRLGGVTIPHDRGLLGHSDGDAVLHALCDALLGAVAAGDVGRHFPDSEARFKDSDSALLLGEVVQLLRQRGHQVGNADITIHAEQPRLAPYIEAMRERIASLLAVSVDRVSVKAKTMEGMDAVGRGEAIAATAVVLCSAIR